MDFYKLFKSFLGIPNSVPPEDFRFDSQYPSGYNDQDDNGFMSNPMQFHKFVEEQMQSLFGSFGLGNIGEDGNPFNTEKSLSLREHYLKPGYDHPSSNKTDTDMDGKVNMEDLNLMLKESHNGDKPISQYSKSPSTNRFFSRSMSTKTIIKPDGSVETTKTSRDNKGNTETTVIKRDGQTEHIVTTRITASGEETKEENLIHHTGDVPELPQCSSILPQSPKSWFDLFF